MEDDLVGAVEEDASVIPEQPKVQMTVAIRAARRMFARNFMAGRLDCSVGFLKYRADRQKAVSVLK